LYIVLTILLLAFSIGISDAQIEESSTLWTLNVGFGSVRNYLSGDDLNVYNFNTTLETTLDSPNWMLGANLAFSNSSDNYSIQGASIDQSFSNTMVFLTGRYLVSSLGSWVPYIGLGLGVNFGGRQTSLNGAIRIDDELILNGYQAKNSVAIAFPVGVNVFATKTLFINANITTLWLEDTFFNDNVFFFGNLGVGFIIN